jgi:hypothetical protein
MERSAITLASNDGGAGFQHLRQAENGADAIR